MTRPCLRSTRVYSGRVINLDVDVVRFPDGSQGELEMIRHSGASAVLPILGRPSDPSPELLLIRQYRYAAERFIYEVPAGRLDPGESPDDCARRELTEETGFIAGRVEPLTTIFTTPGFTDERIHLFLAWDLEQGTESREADEFIEVVTVPLARALSMIESGEIADSKTVVSILHASAFRLSPMSRERGERP